MVQMCKNHWEAMREAVEHRGMEHLVSQTGEEAAEAIGNALQGGKPTRDDWDPLLNANFAIIGRVMDALGHSQGPEAAIGFMATDVCPLCIVQEDFDAIKDNPAFNPERHLDSQGWIDSCMDAMQTYAMERGFIPGRQ